MEEHEKPSRLNPRVRKDSKNKQKGTKKHDPKVDYDRRDSSWKQEQDWDEFPEERNV